MGDPQPPEGTITCAPDEQIILQRYRVLRRLGGGGMGVVYEAEHMVMQSRHAIKVLHTRLRGTEGNLIAERFLREARLCVSLRHPNLVMVTDCGIDDGHPVIVMDLIDGSDLAPYSKDGKGLPPLLVARIGQQVAGALAVLHQRGIIHRDLKPANLMLERGTGRVVLMDLGISRQASDTSDMTQDSILGTPAYMAPEQARSSKSVTTAADIYSLGATLVALLAGRPPVGGGSAHEIITRVRERVYTKGSIEGLYEGFEKLGPPELLAIVRDATRFDPSKRPDAATVAQRLRDIDPLLAAQAPSELAEQWRPLLQMAPPTVASGGEGTQPRLSPTMIAAAPTVTLPTPPPAAPRPLRWPVLVAAIAAGVVVLAAGAWWLWLRPASPDSPPPLPAAALGAAPPAAAAPAATALPAPPAAHEPRTAPTSTQAAPPAAAAPAMAAPPAPPAAHEPKTAPTSAPEAPPAAAAWPSQVDLVLPSGARIEMRLVPPGTTRLGTDDSDRPHERPRVSVTFTRPRWMSRFEITCEQYAEFLRHSGTPDPGQGQFVVDAQGLRPAPNAERLPVRAVTLHDARAFCAWLSSVCGATVRLPGEAEWEYAARGPQSRLWPWGDTWHPQFVRADGRSAPAPVGSYPQGASWCGLEDMAGNVFEWTDDWFDEQRWSTIARQDPRPDPPTEADMLTVVRGGCYANPRLLCRTSTRIGVPAQRSDPAIGFRIVIDAPPPSASQQTP